MELLKIIAYKRPCRNIKSLVRLFETYWLVEYDNSLYIIDQHCGALNVFCMKRL